MYKSISESMVLRLFDSVRRSPQVYSSPALGIHGHGVLIYPAVNGYLTYIQGWHHGRLPHLCP